MPLFLQTDLIVKYALLRIISCSNHNDIPKLRSIVGNKGIRCLTSLLTTTPVENTLRHRGTRYLHSDASKVNKEVLGKQSHCHIGLLTFFVTNFVDINHQHQNQQYMFVNNNKQPQALFFKFTSSLLKLSNGGHIEMKLGTYALYIFSVTITCFHDDRILFEKASGNFL